MIRQGGHHTPRARQAPLLFLLSEHHVLAMPGREGLSVAVPRTTDYRRLLVLADVETLRHGLLRPGTGNGGRDPPRVGFPVTLSACMRPVRAPVPLHVMPKTRDL